MTKVRKTDINKVKEKAWDILRLFCVKGYNMTEIIVSIITGVLTLVGVVITNSESNRKIEHKLEVSQAITDTKLENLTQEVRRQTDFALRIPVLEQRVSNCEDDIKELKNG